MGPYGASAAHFVMDLNLQDRLLLADQVMIGSDGSAGTHHPRGHGTFARIIERYVVDQKRLSLERAVFKMTGLPARTLGLTKRGRLAAGQAADVLVFPNLDAAHISIKLLRHVAGTTNYGHIVMGLARPAAQVPRTASANTILGTAAVVGLKAINFHDLYPDGEVD